MHHATTSIGGLAFRYLTGRARWYLTGITSLREMLIVLHTVPPTGWPVRRGRGRSGVRSRRSRTGR